MCGKILSFTVCFLGFVSLQLVQSKNPTPLTPRPGNHNVSKCFTCDTADSCHKPQIVSCDQKSANATLKVMNTYFKNVENVTSTHFECLKATYHFKNRTVIDVRGCIYAGVNPCSLHPKNSSFVNSKCNTCQKDLCNPAANVSGSLSILMLTSILSIMFGKFSN